MNQQNITNTTLSRSELQSLLKRHGLKATGTTQVLRERAALIHTPDHHHYPSSARRVIDLTDDGDGEGSSSPSKKPKKVSSSRPPKQPKQKKETRLRRFRTTCSSATRQRIDRARTQQMFLVKMGTVVSPGATVTPSCDFVVLGSTGNVYKVTIGPEGNCDCPDHAKGNLCKHVLFVLLKVFRLDPNSYLIYQAAWVPSELQQMFAQLTRRMGQVSGGGASVLANTRVRAAYDRLESGAWYDPNEEEEDNVGVNRQPIEADSDCSICFDALGSNPSKLTYCRAQCGANFHKACLKQWLQVQQTSQKSCPNCRQAWETPNSRSGEAATSDEGYANLGRLQGQSPIRDTSTYNSPSYYGKRGGYYGGRW